MDETTLQPVHALHVYDEHHVLFGARPADLLTPQADGSILVDLRRFDETVSST